MRRSVHFASAVAFAVALGGSFAFGSGSSWAASGHPAPPTAARALVRAARAGDPSAPLVDESFTHATADPAFAGYAGSCLTGAAPVSAPPPGGEHPLGGCPYSGAVGPVPPGNADPHGYLWLTDAGRDESAAVLYTKPVPANEGLRVGFDQWQYGGTVSPSPADGISFFLVDGAATLDAPGAFGGSLGYAQKLPDNNPAEPFLPGVNHGYLGLGLDVLGNYFGDWEHRGFGCTPPQTSPAGTAFHVPAPGSNMLTVRGPGHDTEGYCWLGATYAGTSSPFSSTLHGSLHGPTTSVSSDPATAEAQLEASRRRVTVEITPAPHPLMTVTVDYSDGRGPQAEIRDMPLPQPVPASYKFGFGASTGSFTDVHLIRNVAVSPYTDLPQLNLVKQLDKDFPLPNPITAGTELHYQFVVTNSGIVPLTDVHVEDPVVGPVSCPSRTLEPGQTETCTGTYRVTGADVSRGFFHNAAIALAEDNGATVRSPEAEFDVPIARSEVLELTKKVDSSQTYLPGETATYEYVVTNTSDQEVNDIVVHDDRVTGITCESRSLTPAGTPGAATTCTGHYTVTSHDAGIGHVINTADARGVGADGTNVTSPPDVAEIVVAPAAPSLHVEKLVDAGHPYEPGALVEYKYIVTNTGNVPVTAISVVDDHVAGITCETTTLARAGTPGDSTTCHGDYTVTEEDAVLGHVTNHAHATGTHDGEAVDSPPAQAEIRVELPSAVLQITKSVDDTHVYEPGQSVTYHYTVTNTSHVAVSAIDVVDDRITGVTCASTRVEPTGFPGDSTTCTGHYTVTADDVAAGHVINKAFAAGIAAGRDIVSEPAVAEIRVVLPATVLTITKTVDDSHPYEPGQVVTYHYTVTNVSGVPVTDLDVVDDRVTGITCDATTLAPVGESGDETDCAGRYTVTEQDAAAGRVTNHAHAVGTAAGQEVISRQARAEIHVALPSRVLELRKEPEHPGPYQPGQTVTYRYTVTNTSHVTVRSVEVVDDRVSDVTCQATTLEPVGSPGDSTTCTGRYQVTEDDLVNGHVINKAFAEGTAAGREVVSETAHAEISVELPANVLELKKTVDDSRAYEPGDVVKYTYKVRNVSGVEVTDLEITDDRVSGITCDSTSLAPHASTTCTGYYTVTAADAEAGHVVNTAHAEGTAAGRTVQSPSERAEICIVAASPTLTPTTPTTPPTSPTTPPTKPTSVPTHRPPHGHLPGTGAYVTVLLWLAAAALGTGGLVFAGSRRRSGSRHS